MCLAQFKQFTFRLITSLVLISSCVNMSACASESYATKGAKQGAASGAAAGAVGGLISALVFGGDPLERAARGAVYGGATGAVAGGISGGRVDKQIKAQTEAETQANTEAQARALTQIQTPEQNGTNQDAELDALRKEIGDDAFLGLASLAECNHDETMERAKKARKSKNPNYSLAGLWLETLSYADRHKKKRLRKIVPSLVKQDWEINNKTEAEAAIRQASADLTEIRREYNLPLVCGA